MATISRKNFNTSGILKYVYPLVEKGMNTHLNEWKQFMSQFIQARSTSLFDIGPFDRIVFSEKDAQALYQAIDINESDVMNGIQQTYYWKIDPFKPRHAKDPCSIVALCIIRYFLLKKDNKNLDLAMVFQAFSGKYYPSIHYSSFPEVTPAKYRHVMEYVINNKLSHKFEMKAAGSVIGSVKMLNSTWIETYNKELVRFEDEDITYCIQQLHNRLKSMIKNVAVVYYEAYKNREYIAYDKDQLPEEEGGGPYHLTSNDSFRLQQYVENTMVKMNSSQVDYKTCKMCADANVKTEEIKSIFEAIFNNRENITLVREYVTCMIASYLAQSQNKDISTIQFFKFSIAVKPNAKDPVIVRMKEIIEKLLDDNSVAYRKRKHRNATKSSYHKAFATYFAINIINANK